MHGLMANVEHESNALRTTDVAYIPVGADGARMPLVGFGTCCRKSSTGKPIIQSTRDYLAAGGRLIDTAQMYGNHRELMRAIKASSVPRAELWVTSKVNTKKVTTRIGAKHAVASSVRELGLTFLDLVLLHGAFSRQLGEREALWRGLMDAKRAKLVREIGVSNFNREQLQELMNATGVKPAVVQLEYHPWVAQSTHDYVKWLQAQGVAVTAYASLRPRGQQVVGGANGVAQVAKRYGVSSAQVLLRWAIDQSVAVIPGATSKEHIVDNLHLADFHLTPSDLSLLASDGTTLMGGQLPPSALAAPAVEDLSRHAALRRSTPMQVTEGATSNRRLSRKVLNFARQGVVDLQPCTRANNEKPHAGSPGELGNSSLESSNLFHFENAFLLEHWATFTTQGYFAMRDLVSADSLRAISARYQPFGYEARASGFRLVQQSGCMQQPRRLKIKITNSSADVSAGVFSGIPEQFANIVRDTQSIVKSFNKVYFIAYCILKQAASRRTSLSKPTVVMDPSVDYRARLAKIAQWKIHINAAFPGSVYQNPHYDVSREGAARTPLFIDIPLATVDNRLGAPLEVWPATQKAVYEQTLPHSQGWTSQITPCERQYFYCWPEVQALSKRWPSALRYSTLGEATVRNPATWHRGTPNELGVVRDQFLFMFSVLHERSVQPLPPPENGI